MKRARLRRMLTWALTGPLLLLGILGITFLILIRWLMVEIQWVDHTDRVISQARGAETLVIDMETGLRGYLLTRRPEFLGPYATGTKHVDEAFDDLQKLVVDNGPQETAARELVTQYRRWKDVVDALLRGGNATPEAQLAEKNEMDRLRQRFDAFVRAEERLRASRTSSVQRTTGIVVGSSALLAVLFGALVGFGTRRALKNVASEYAVLLDEAQAANLAKDEFLATLSHELRTPLTAILGWARLLQVQEYDRDNLELGLETIERSARNQAALVEDILDVSRIVTGKMALELRDVDFGAIVRTTVDAVRPAAAAKGIAIDLATPGVIPLRGDSTRLQQIVVNLLTNAVKFSSGGATIAVEAAWRDDDAVLTVHDEGRGIDPAFLPFVFDRFRQADSTSTREYGGLGIGLSIVKLLTELHGGRVRAESGGLGQGSTFTVVLPAAARKREAAARFLAETATGDGLRDREILVVDDDEAARTVISAMLRSAGARVTTAPSVEEAMRSIARHKFAAILTDIAMPNENGQELLRRVRAAGEPNAATPVIAVTAANAATVEGAFDARVQKPVDPSDLARAVAATIA